MAVGQPTVVLQGVETPNVSVDPESFFRYTRRLRFPMKSLTTFAGFGSTDSVSLRQTGVVSKLLVRVTGTITLAAATATTSEWPYNLIRAFRVAANGQSNLINASGLQVKMLNTMGNPALTSKGVTRAANQAAAAGTATAGTLSLASEDWGTFSATVNMGPAVTALTANAYTVDLYYEVPLAFDDKYLTGAIYAQTNATQLTLDIDWESTANLLSAGSTTANTLQYQVLGEVFSIPNVSGRYVVPDLSAFHSLIGFRQSGPRPGRQRGAAPGHGRRPPAHAALRAGLLGHRPGGAARQLGGQLRRDRLALRRQRHPGVRAERVPAPLHQRAGLQRRHRPHLGLLRLRLRVGVGVP
jgi:hypothetical protein